MARGDGKGHLEDSEGASEEQHVEEEALADARARMAVEQQMAVRQQRVVRLRIGRAALGGAAGGRAA